MIEYEDTSREEDTLLHLDELEEELKEVQAKLDDFKAEDERHEKRIKELSSKESRMSLEYERNRLQHHIFWVQNWKKGLELTAEINELLKDTGFEIRDEEDYCGGFLERVEHEYTPVQCVHAQNMLDLGQVKFDD